MSNVACDVMKASMSKNNSLNQGYTLLSPYALRRIPLYMLSLIKSVRLAVIN